MNHELFIIDRLFKKDQMTSKSEKIKKRNQSQKIKN